MRLTSIIAVVALGALSLSAQHKPATARTHAAKTAAKAPTKLGPGIYATFVTSKGQFVVQLFPKDAPKSVANFVGLAEGKHPYKDPLMGGISTSKLYDGLLFFRTVPGYLIQTGDPLNNGRGTLGYSIPDEKNSLQFDQAGRMSLAQAGPGSRGSQIFFTLKPVPDLGKQGFVVIGQIVRGLDVAMALSEGPHKSQDIPTRPNILQHVTITTIP